MAFTLKAKGIFTYRNELNVPEGSMDFADNIVIDESDVIEMRRGQADYGDSLPADEDRVKQLLEYKRLILRHYNDVLQFDNGSGTFTNFNGTYNELEAGLRIKYIEANGNLYFTENGGIKKISAKNQSQVTASSIENAGVPKATSISANTKFVEGGFLPPQSKCAYRVLWGKRDNNNYLLLGSPSERYVLTNSSNSVEVSENSQLTIVNVPTNNDYVLLSSVNTDYFIWYFTTSGDEAPETSETLGRTAIMVDVSAGGITTTQVASRTANAIAAVADFEVSVSTTIVTITNVEEGNATDIQDLDAATGLSSTNLTAVTLEQGSITEGSFANGVVTISVPDDIDSTYFFQIYRTGNVTVPAGLTLDDIDPGDEMNLVYEEAYDVNSLTIVDNNIIVEDIVPEDFRASAVFLYTNPISGEGILQANARPPVAKDIALFKNSTFYANTRTAHTLQFNLVSVLNFQSGISTFTVGNSQATRTYTAIGATQVQDVTVTSNTIGGKAFLIDSARDEREYFIYFDEDGLNPKPTDAEFDNKIAVRVRYDSGDSTDTIATKAKDAIEATGDFSVSVVGSVMTITWAKNGNVTNDARDSVAQATGFTFSVPITDGDGEDYSNQEFLLSNISSVALSIDETARSLVNAINADSLSEVNAFYLSGADDVPGIIALESKDLEDDTFYIASSDSNILSSFDPSLPLQRPITLITAGVQTNIESVGHNLVNGDEVYIHDTLTTPAIRGIYNITVVDVDNFTIDFETTVGSVNEGDFYKTTVESTNDVAGNRLYFSKSDRPEAVPALNFINIGPQDKEILRILPLRDNLFALKEDGVYIVSGTTAPNFTSRLLDGSVRLVSPDSAVVLDNAIYALTDDGVVRISETGVEVISRPIENLIKSVTNAKMDFKYSSFGVSYSSDRSYLLYVPTTTSDTVATQCYRFNSYTRTWTRFTLTATCGLVAESDDKMYLGYGDRNLMNQERKNFDRTDYADRDFTNTLLPNGVSGSTITLSNLTDIEEGDVILQEQYITISVVRRLLKQLDIDNGTSNDYESSIDLSKGITMSSSLTDINSKLIVDGITVTPVVFSDDIETQRDEYNTMIDEINGIASGTQYKDYDQATKFVTYESIVLSTNSINNTVTLGFEIPILQGTVRVYKGIVSKIQYSPQHFGDPTSLKQIRQGTIIFDQNAFYGGTISYASDQSADFVDTPFSGYGTGDWGLSWGEGTWGGLGNDIPYRTLVPLEKQRCRYLTIKITHCNAREIVRINGISLLPRELSKRAYR